MLRGNIILPATALHGFVQNQLWKSHVLSQKKTGSGLQSFASQPRRRSGSLLGTYGQSGTDTLLLYTPRMRAGFWGVDWAGTDRSKGCPLTQALVTPGSSRDTFPAKSPGAPKAR